MAYPRAKQAAAAFHDQVTRLIPTPLAWCKSGSPPAVAGSCQLGHLYFVDQDVSGWTAVALHRAPACVVFLRVRVSFKCTHIPENDREICCEFSFFNCRSYIQSNTSNTTPRVCTHRVAGFPSWGSTVLRSHQSPTKGINSFKTISVSCPVTFFMA